MNRPTVKQQELIRNNWLSVREKGLRAVGVDMYCRLFTIHPEMMSLFSFADKQTVKELRSSPRLARHASSVFCTFDGAIDDLNDLLNAVPKLVALGGRHFKYGIKPESFGFIHEAFMATLLEVCGEKLTDEARQAFNVFYCVLVAIISSGFNAAKENCDKK